MKFTNDDIEKYYDQTEVHYRMFWKLEKVMGLHYGVWNNDTKNIEEAILNTNHLLKDLGEIKNSDRILDAGCGIGGSSIYLAKNIGCKTEGISLSKKQVGTASILAKKNGVGHLCKFSQQDYTATNFEDNSFDIVWAIESLGSAPDKEMFFKEMNRIVKPGGKILIADTFKSFTYDISSEKDMQTMLNGWAISDILSVDQLSDVASKYHFIKTKMLDVTPQIKRSVDLMYRAAIFGMLGTKIYNFFKKASYFSRIHYTAGLAQKRTYKKGKWGYYLFVFEKRS